MFRRLLRLIRMMLPAVIVSVAWAGWWLFGDGPIKVSRPDREIAGADLWQVGPTTVVEAPTGGIPPDQRRYVYWRELDTGKCIIEPILQTTSNVWLARDEKTLIVALDNGPIQLFDRTTGRLRKELPALGLWKQRRQVFFTPDHKSMTYEALDGSIIVADVATGSVAYRFPDLRAPVGISPDGQIVVAAKDQTTLVVRDLSTDADVTETSCADVDDIMEPVVGPGGRRILLMTRNAGQYIHELWSTDPPGRQKIDVRKFAYRSAFSRSGRYAETMFSPVCRVWDVARWPPVEISAMIGSTFYTPNFSPSSRLVVTTNATGTEWQLRDDESLEVLVRGPIKSHRDSLEFSDDERWLMINERQTGILQSANFHFANSTGHALFSPRRHIIDVISGKRVRTLPVVTVMSFSNDGAGVWALPSHDWRGGYYQLWSLTPPRPPW